MSDRLFCLAMNYFESYHDDHNLYAGVDFEYGEHRIWFEDKRDFYAFKKYMSELETAAIVRGRDYSPLVGNRDDIVEVIEFLNETEVD